MIGIDYKKAYYMVLQSWMIDGLKMYKISDKRIKFIQEAVKNWRVKLTAGRTSVAELKIQWGMFQGDAQPS